jgi:hypothetical protein
LRAAGRAEFTSLDTPAERHKQARHRQKNKDEEALQRKETGASSLDLHLNLPLKTGWTMLLLTETRFCVTLEV